MKFGKVAVQDAQGAILAHSLNLTDGRLRKGVLLDAARIARINAAGIRQVTVARLELGDVHEDDAAHELARALSGGVEFLELSQPFTGRTNVIACQPGLVLIDADAVTAANSVDPMITISTVPPYHQTRNGGMVATIKVISYAIPKTTLDAVVECAKGAIKIAAAKFQTASLIVSETPGGPGKKGVSAIENRLAALGASLSETINCNHSEPALAQAISDAGGDVILILTGSATSDLRDTAPQALKRAGGDMIRFGIPVDPGNLLFLGSVDDRPVIGLPGSARSPVLHGADWVLSRVICGKTPTDDEFAAMGVGGLLKEIPTRPMPRRGHLKR